MVLNLPLDECIDNTQSPIQNLKKNKKKKEKEALPSDPKPKNKQVQRSPKSENLGPLRQGQRLDTTEMERLT